MPNKRSEIRAAVRTALIANDDSVPVDMNRVTPVMTHELPRIVIRTPKETSRVFAESPRILMRHLTVVVEVLAEAEKLDGILDGIGQKIEEALNGAPMLGGIARDQYLIESETDFDASGERPVGSLRLKYEVQYLTDETPPGQSSDLRGINVHYL